MSETTLRHIEHFTNTIGPRGSATAKEAEAHDYCQATLEGLGYEVHRETFLAPVSAWHPYALAEALMLVAVAIFVLLGQGADAGAGGLAAAALALVVLVSYGLQLSHRANPLAWFLPLGQSQNVWALAAPSGEERERVVLVGHVDTHRAALAMQSPALWQFFRVATPVIGLGNLALLVVFIVGMFAPSPLNVTLALVLSILPVVALVFTLQPDFTPYVKGANDNATGASAVLAFAERLKSEPLQHTAVYLVNTGSEETGGHGLADWIKRHGGSDADDADYLVLDNIGGQGSDVNYIVDETVLLPVPADDGLVEIAEQVAGENTALDAKPFHYGGLFTEMSVAVMNNQRALGLGAFDPKTGMPPNFHTVRDDVANVDPAVLERSEQLAWAIIHEIDQEAGADQGEREAGQAIAEAVGEAETPANGPTGEQPAGQAITQPVSDDLASAAGPTSAQPADPA